MPQLAAGSWGRAADGVRRAGRPQLGLSPETRVFGQGTRCALSSIWGSYALTELVGPLLAGLCAHRRRNAAAQDSSFQELGNR